MSPLTPEQQEELAKIFAANRARQDALTGDRIEGQAEAKIRLVQSTDDPPLFSSEAQTELRGVRDAFRAESIDASASFMVMDSPDAGGGYIGEFIIPLAQIGAPAVAGIVVAWLHSKFGRKVRVEFYADGAIKRVEAQTPEQISSVIELARREAQPRPKKQPK
jgi:hypothetical protein